MDCNLPELKRGKRKMKDAGEAGNKPNEQHGYGESSLEVEPTTGRVKVLLDIIDPHWKELTKYESGRFVKILSDRNHRKYKKAEKDDYKNTVDETIKYLKDIKFLMEEFKGTKAENEMFRDEKKEMEAEIKKLQNHNMEILEKSKYFTAEKERFQSENKEMMAKSEELLKKLEELRKIAADNQMSLAGMSQHVISNLDLGVTPEAWGTTANTVHININDDNQTLSAFSNEQMRELGLETDLTPTPNISFDAGASTSTGTQSIEGIVMSLMWLQNKVLEQDKVIQSQQKEMYELKRFHSNC